MAQTVKKIGVRSKTNMTFLFISLKTIENIQPEPRSIFDDANGFYKIVKKTTVDDNETFETEYLRQSSGGIWMACDEISGTFDARHKKTDLNSWLASDWILEV